MLDFPLVDHEAVQDQCMYLKNRVLVKEVIKKAPNMKAVFPGINMPQESWKKMG